MTGEGLLDRFKIAAFVSASFGFSVLRNPMNEVSVVNAFLGCSLWSN